MTDRVLFLGPPESGLPAWIEGEGDVVTQTTARLTPQLLEEADASLLVSYGYRFILGKPVLDRFEGRAVNLHISLLPWNKGADPNFWSFLDSTPKGVTIHYLDEGVDTGDIIVQSEMSFDSEVETLATTYAALCAEIERLFQVAWVDIKGQSCPRRRQAGTGTSHRVKDKEPYLYLLTEGWDTPVGVLETYGRAHRLNRS
ncbi:MAG: formyl transferase [bacterium]|nr:formyl transferase [bacterium]